MTPSTGCLQRNPLARSKTASSLALPNLRAAPRFLKMAGGHDDTSPKRAWPCGQSEARSSQKATPEPVH